MLDHRGGIEASKVKERLRARSATIPHRAHLRAVRCAAARTKRGSPSWLPSPPHPREGGLREAGSDTGVRLCLLEVADESCSATTLRRQRDEWISAGVMDTLQGLVLEAYDRIIRLELNDVVVDGCITKAPCGGERAGKSPVDRGKQGIKRSTVVDGEGSHAEPSLPQQTATTRPCWMRPWIL